MKRSPALIVLVVLAMLGLILPLSASPEVESYIVVLKAGERADVVASGLAAESGAELRQVYSHALQGMTMRMSAKAAAALARNPRVAYVEPDVVVTAAESQTVPTGISRIGATVNPPTVPMDVDLAIIDTGIFIGTNSDGSSRSHLDLNLRYVTDCTGAVFYPVFGGCTSGGNVQDENGHGTHVAGIASALDNTIGSIGVAPGTTLWSFKVLDASGTGSGGGLLAAIDTVAANANRIEVANMSLELSGTLQALNDAIAGATDQGVVFVVAAGNGSADANLNSPANSEDAITVSALSDFDGLPGGLGGSTCREDQDDTLADFSNFGSAIDIAAPGVCIFSTDLFDGYSTKSGTSMSSPYVAGAVARYIAEQGLDPQSRADVEAIKAAVIGAAAPQASECGFTGDSDGYPEPVLFVNSALFGGDGACGSGGPVNLPPTADFDSACTDLNCAFTDLSSDPDGSVVSWDWDFGDSTTSTEQSPNHTYTVAGDYEVTLIVTDDAGGSTSHTETITVTDSSANRPPMAGFSSSCNNLDCDLINTSNDPDGDPLTYMWDFGDGSTSTASNPAHTYGAAGTYTVSLTVDDGLATDTAAQSVTVTEPTPSTNLTGFVLPLSPIDPGTRTGYADVGVIDSDGIGLPGALVEGVWTFLDRRGREKTTTGTATSDAAGFAFFSQKFAPGATLISFCITNVTLDGYTYVPSVDCGVVLE